MTRRPSSPHPQPKPLALRLLLAVSLLVVMLAQPAQAQAPVVTPVPMESPTTDASVGWVLFAGEEVAPLSCRIPVPERAEALLKSYPDGTDQLVINAGFAKPTLVQATVYRADDSPPARVANMRVFATGRVDTTAAPSDALSVVELQWAENTQQPGEDTVSTQWAARLLRAERQLEIWAAGSAEPAWISVGSPLPISLENVDVSVELVASETSTGAYVGTVDIAVGGTTYERNVDGIAAGRLVRPGWAPSSTFALEAGSTDAGDPCRDRMGAAAVVHYDLNRSGFTLAGPPPEPCNGLIVTVNLALGEVPTNGPDVIMGTAGDDVIAAGDGDDIICGNGGADSIWGQDGDDLILGGDGDDRLRGGDGDDTLRGEAGVDNLAGGRGDDLVYGGSDDDQKLRGGTGDDFVDGGSGNDVLVAGNGGNDIVQGGAGDDKVTGGPRPDEVYGGDGADEVKGLGGADQLFGGPGDDTLFGGAQADQLDGGDGSDTCNGGTTGNGALEFDAALNCEGALILIP